MKTWLWILILVTAPVIVAGCDRVQPPRTQLPSENKQAEPAVQPVEPAVQTDRNLNADEAAALALSAVKGDPKLLDIFSYNPADKDFVLSIEPLFARKVPLPSEKESYEFEVNYSNSDEGLGASWVIVAVNRRTGELRFKGIWYCDKAFVKKDEFLSCVYAPPVRQVPPPVIPADRDMNEQEAYDMAMSVIHSDMNFLKSFIDPNDRNQRLFLESGGPGTEYFPPKSKRWHGFTVYGEQIGGNTAQMSFHVAVHPRTGEVLFLGNGSCEDVLRTKDQFMKCLESGPAGSEE